MKRIRKQTFQLGWLDFSLSALASCLAVYSVGMGLRIPEVSWFFVGWIALGTLVSYGLSRVIPDRHAWVGGLIYSLASVGSVAFVQTLNSWLPKGGFPLQLIIAASLAYMLLFGSFLTWRDSTIVFQAVPAIAIFGLVGAWDTFAGAPFAFFGFLLCFATLFARAHGRIMMMQAEDSGFSSGHVTPSSEGQTGLFDALKRGPWRWMAGPEWALGSAAVIVLLSVVGAPVLQSSVQGVAGFVSIQVPQARASSGALNSTFIQNSLGNVNVGQGPRRNLRKRPVFTARLTDLDRQQEVSAVPTYFRLRTYETYTGRGWQPVGDFPNRAMMNEAIDDESSFMNRSRRELKDYSRIQFDLELLGSNLDGIPLPGELEYLSNPTVYARRMDGMARQLTNAPFQPGVGGIARVPKLDTTPKKSVLVDPGYVQDTDKRIPDRVKEFAVAVTAQAKSDWEKAMKIKEAIASRVVYDLEAPPVPSGADPADWFLFEGRKGYCDLFATAMTVMARSVRLPARYVTGYYPALGIINDQGRVVLHESEAHAWCEIFFEGVGWVPFDATEGARDVGRPTAEEPLIDQEWFRAVLFTVGGLALVGTPVLVAHVMKRRRQPKDPTIRLIATQYARFVRGLERATGKPKRPSQTPREYWAIVSNLVPRGHDQGRELTEVFEELLYSPKTQDVGSLKARVSDMLATLKRR